MALSRQQRILEYLLTIAEGIRRDRGYDTDVGKAVLFGELPDWGPDDTAEALAIVPGEIQCTWKLQNKKKLMPVDLMALVAPGVRNPLRRADVILTDLKKAFDRIDDQTLGGLLVQGHNSLGLSEGTIEYYPRRSGSNYSGYLWTLVCPFVEAVGEPEA